MNFNILLTTEMAGITQTLLDPSTQTHKFAKKDAMIASIFGKVQEAHDSVAGIQAAAGAISEQVAQLTDLLGEKDGRADELYGACVQTARGAARLLPDGPQRGALNAAIEIAFPGDARDTIHAPYAAAAGEAQNMRERLTPGARAALAEVSVYGVTVEAALDQWIALSDEVGALDSQRSQLMATEDPTALSRAELRSRRNQWARVMRSFVSLVELSDLTPTERKLVLADVEAVVERAAARAEKREA